MLGDDLMKKAILSKPFVYAFAGNDGIPSPLL
jgi:hypothetical protein